MMFPLGGILGLRLNGYVYLQDRTPYCVDHKFLFIFDLALFD